LQFHEAGAASSIISLGDSHAAVLGPSLLELAHRSGYAYQHVVESSCPYINEVKRFTNGKASVRCNSRLDARRKFLLSLPPSIIVITSRLPLYLSGRQFDNAEGGLEGNGSYEVRPDHAGDEVTALLRPSVLELIEHGHNVVLVYPIPEVGWNAPRRLMMMAAQHSPFGDRREAARAVRVSTSLEVYRARSSGAKAALDAIGEHPNLFRVYPDRALCSEAAGRCYANDAGGLLYVDDDHLSRRGADLVAGQIIAALRPVLARR
jgi:hypothetical protein